MRVLWIAMLLCAGAILVLALALPGNIPHDPYSPPLAGEKLLNGSGQTAVTGLLTGHTGTMTGNKTALFSKKRGSRHPVYCCLALQRGYHRSDLRDGYYS